MKILITGGNRGIGKATALLLSKEGHEVDITYNTHEEEAKDVASTINGKYYHLDVTDEKSIVDFSKKISKIDVLINNSGVLTWKPLKEQSFEEIDLQIDVNLRGLVKLTKSLIDKVGQVLINISSAAGKTGYASLSTYCGTKFGVRGFTESLINEYPDLRIHTVNPGLTKTAMSNFQGVEPEEVAKIIFNTINGKYEEMDVDVTDLI